MAAVLLPTRTAMAERTASHDLQVSAVVIHPCQVASNVETGAVEFGSGCISATDASATLVPHTHILAGVSSTQYRTVQIDF